MMEPEDGKAIDLDYGGDEEDTYFAPDCAALDGAEAGVAEPKFLPGGMPPASTCHMDIERAGVENGDREVLEVQRELPSLSLAELDDIEEKFLSKLLVTLGEKNEHLFRRILVKSGMLLAQELLNESLQALKQGGLVTANGDRKKTPGGIFIALLKSRLPKETIKEIWDEQNRLQAALKKKKKEEAARRSSGLAERMEEVETPWRATVEALKPRKERRVSSAVKTKAKRRGVVVMKKKFETGNNMIGGIRPRANAHAISKRHKPRFKATGLKIAERFVVRKKLLRMEDGDTMSIPAHHLEDSPIEIEDKNLRDTMAREIELNEAPTLQGSMLLGQYPYHVLPRLQNEDEDDEEEGAILASDLGGCVDDVKMHMHNMNAPDYSDL